MKLKLNTTLMAVILLLISQVSYGQTIDLGGASDFAVFTAVGAFTVNVADTSTIVTGDVGTDEGAFTGFPPGELIGEIHVADAVSAQAAADVKAAYGSLSTVTCDSVIGVTMGNGQVLPPNVYCIGAASTITGVLTLDAQDDPGAIFIFKIDGALATAVSSSINLINGASLCNVYWQVNGQVDLGENSLFQGIMLVNGAINLLDGATLNGQALSQAGAITLSNNLVTIGGCAALPLELLHFDGIAFDRKVQLAWTTASESNIDYFTIQRSVNGLDWEELSNIHGAGNSSTLLNYIFIDQQPYFGISYYRLKQTDFDGHFSLSKIIAFNCDNHIHNVILYPNPFSFETTLQTENIFKSATLIVHNSFGQTVKQIDNLSGQTITLHRANLPSGRYFVVMLENNNIIYVDKLVITD